VVTLISQKDFQYLTKVTYTSVSNVGYASNLLSSCIFGGFGEVSGNSALLPAPPCSKLEPIMYEDFKVTDHWTGEDLHCEWKGTVVAIATRHADATDIRFAVNGRPVWIAMPNLAWVEQKRRTGYVITDYLAAQAAGRYLQHAIQSGYDNGREMYTMTVDEVLEHANAVVKEAGRTDNLPSLPVINADIRPEDEMGIHLPGEPA
jgi:hypothetical protein